jgi:hypothetical protein
MALAAYWPKLNMWSWTPTTTAKALTVLFLDSIIMVKLFCSNDPSSHVAHVIVNSITPLDRSGDALSICLQSRCDARLSQRTIFHLCS